MSVVFLPGEDAVQFQFCSSSSHHHPLMGSARELHDPNDSFNIPIRSFLTLAQERSCERSTPDRCRAAPNSAPRFLLQLFKLPTGLCRLNFVFILWISMTLVCSGYPVVPSMSSNPFYLNCQLYGKSDYCLVLVNNCLATVGRNEELAFLKPYLEMPFNKRSFRNGVGSGIKKTSFRRAKS
ncbi:PREDICTED: neuropeptide S [Pygoscelis adeliae]|nr:PREDICTED: neuropeptide S [Pygoscelis adeliae]